MTVKPKYTVEIRATESSTITRPYLTYDHTTELSAAADVVSYITGQGELTIGNLELVNVSARRIDESTIWEATAVWGRFEQRDPPTKDEFPDNTAGDLSFEIGTVTARVKTLPLVGKFPNTADTPLYVPSGTSASPDGTLPGHAVNVREDGIVEGLEVQIPALRWAETVIKPVGWINTTRMKTLYELVKKVNNGSFRGFAAGEVFFDSVYGHRRGQFDEEVTFRFIAAPNETGVVIGDITVGDVQGHDYIWTTFKPVEQLNSGDPVATPEVVRSVYVQRPYARVDFSLIGIGTGTIT